MQNKRQCTGMIEELKSKSGIDTAYKWAQNTAMDTFGKRLRHVRQRLRRSVIAMANLMGVERDAWYRWERGDSFPQQRHLEVIGNITGASLDWLILGKGDPP